MSLVIIFFCNWLVLGAIFGKEKQTLIMNYCWHKMGNATLSWHYGHMCFYLVRPPEVPLTLNCLIEKHTENDEEKTQKEAKYGHPTFLRVFSRS